MDIAKLILTGTTAPPAPLEQAKNIENATEEKKKQFAKDFESIFINKLLDEMSNTIGDWGFEKDGTFEQVEGIFRLYLSQNIADQGGFGLWKDIYKSLTDSEHRNTVAESPDMKL
jgi:Rod binding domain-containing protein